MSSAFIACGIVGTFRCNHMADRRDLMKILSEKQVLECKNAEWYCKTIQKCKFDKLDVLIETVEKLS